MFTPARQCYRRNRDEQSPGGQELSAPWAADTTSVLREVTHTNPSPGRANTHILKCASNSAGEKRQKELLLGQRGKVLGNQNTAKSRT